MLGSETMEMGHAGGMKDKLRDAVGVVALLNLAYFGVEFGVAVMIGSVSLFADSIDFLEDASINVLILMALAWSTPRRAVTGKMLAGIILIPGLAALWMAWQKFLAPMPPAPVPLSLTGGGIAHQFYLRCDAASLPPSRREPQPGCLPLGAE